MSAPHSPSSRVAIGIGVVIAVDLVTKLAVFALASDNTSGLVFPIRNHEFTLGIAGAPLVATIAIAAAGILIAALLVMPPTRRGELRPWVPACLIGGALANLIDRIAFGSVHDFLVTPVAIVNLADLAVIAALTGIVIARLRSPRAEASPIAPSVRTY
jgi:lipoprotein signal peptidase